MKKADLDLVLFKVGQVFPQERVEEILSILNTYKPADSYGDPRSEAVRLSVFLACLVLCGGDKKALQGYAEIADLDERDVWGPACYPEYMESITREYADYRTGKQTAHTVPNVSQPSREIVLDEDVAEVFTSSEAVNNVLRSILQALAKN